jgi:NADH dehydrogenase
MNVLVVGGDGFIGQYLCTELVECGHEVTSLSRSPDQGALPDAVSTAAVDVTDYDSIEPAFEGRDAVVNLVALSPLFQPSGGNEMHETVHLGGTRNCVRAAEEHGVDRFVQQSALGADPEGTTHYIRAKGKAEDVVRASGLDWVIFRPSIVFGEGGEFVSFTTKLTTPYVTGLPGGGRTRFQPIHVEEFVPMVAAALEDEAHVGETYEIGGPEVVTLAEVAKLAYRARGKSLTILPVPMVLAGLGLSVAGAIPGFPMGADQYRSLQFDNSVADNDVDAFGVDVADLTTLATYLGVSE